MNWISFVKDYQTKNNISFKKAMKDAAPSYRKMKEGVEPNKKIKIIKDKQSSKSKDDKKEPVKKKVIKIIKDKKEPVKKKIVIKDRDIKKQEKIKFEEQQAERKRIIKQDKKFRDEETKRQADFKAKKEKENKRIEQLNKMSLKEIKAETERLKKQLNNKNEKDVNCQDFKNQSESLIHFYTTAKGIISKSHFKGESKKYINNLVEKLKLYREDERCSKETLEKINKVLELQKKK